MTNIGVPIESSIDLHKAIKQQLTHSELQKLHSVTFNYMGEFRKISRFSPPRNDSAHIINSKKMHKNNMPKRNGKHSNIFLAMFQLIHALPLRVSLASPLCALSCAVPQLLYRRYDRNSTGIRSQFYRPG